MKDTGKQVQDESSERIILLSTVGFVLCYCLWGRVFKLSERSYSKKVNRSMRCLLARTWRWSAKRSWNVNEVVQSFRSRKGWWGFVRGPHEDDLTISIGLELEEHESNILQNRNRTSNAHRHIYLFRETLSLKRREFPVQPFVLRLITYGKIVSWY